MIRLVAGDITDSVEWDNKDSVDVEVDCISGGIELDDESLEVKLEADDVEAGFSIVAAPSSKRAAVR